jgi:toxin-antitoxin system PIN domain toxin
VSIGLLDVNVLLALFDPRHVHHEPAQRWLAAAGRKGWATCPITENGFIRIASQPSYPSSPGNATVVRHLLTEFCRQSRHTFWADTVTLRDEKLFDPDVPVGTNHVTDTYLLGLAVHHQGRLITFDRRIPVTAVRGGDKALFVLD